MTISSLWTMLPERPWLLVPLTLLLSVLASCMLSVCFGSFETKTERKKDKEFFKEKKKTNHTPLGYDTTVMVRSILLRGFDQQIADMIGKTMEQEVPLLSSLPLFLLLSVFSFSKKKKKKKTGYQIHPQGHPHLLRKDR